MIHLDTHVLAWLAAGEAGRLSPAARRLVASEPLAASPMAVLELQFLHEIGRLAENAASIMAALGDDLGVTIADLSFAAAVAEAREESWTRDPFDRLIVASARAASVRLVSKDPVIRRHFADAIW